MAIAIETVTWSKAPNGVARIRLDKPPANAIDELLLADLHRALRLVREDTAIRAVVLTGTGTFFSAGFDFAAPRRDDEVALGLYKLYRDCHRDLLALAKPTIAMINGHAIAGGLVLALACDHRLAADGEFKIGLNEVAVGASFPRAASEIVRLRLSHAVAAELILGASLRPMADAPLLGAVSRLVPRHELESATNEVAQRLAAFPRDAYAHAKADLIAAALARIDAESDEEALHTMAVWISEESRAARRRQRETLSGRA